jgi:acyl phosphate:glycerol-3-phosphate acyltransferase
VGAIRGAGSQFERALVNHLLWTTIAAYFLGSIPFGYLIVHLASGRDIRSEGSGNIGAANVTRRAGAAAGVVTLLLDAGKGTLAVWLAQHASAGNIRWMMLAAVAAVVGHVFPVWLRFRGGKGVATGLGVMLLICAKAVALAVILWILVVGFWRYASLGSMAAAAAMPIFVYFLYAPPLAPALPVSIGTTAISILVLWMHRPNLQRLIQGTENRLKLPF